MKWKIKDKDEEVIRDDIKPPPVEVTGKTLDQDIKDTGRKFDYEGGLSLVPLPNGYYRLGSSKLRRGSLGVLYRMRERYGNEIVSYQELSNTIRHKGMLEVTFSLLLSSLWGHGYLEKYAKGYFRQGSVPGQIAGKYSGVHYKVIEKVNE